MCQENENLVVDILRGIFIDFFNGIIDFKMLVLSSNVFQIGQLAEGSRALLGFLILGSAFAWHWGMANFILPAMRILAKEEYYLWLGNQDWQCCCDKLCDKKTRLFHPVSCWISNFLLSDVIFTGLLYWKITSEENEQQEAILNATNTTAGSVNVTKDDDWFDDDNVTGDDFYGLPFQETFGI